MKNIKGLLRKSMQLATIVLFASLFYIAWHLFLNPIKEIPFEHKGNYLVLAIYVIILFYMLDLFGGFKIGYRDAMDVSISQVVAMLGSNFISFFLCMLAISTWHHLGRMLLVFLVLTVLDIIIAVLFTSLFDKLYYKAVPPIDILLIHQEHTPDDIVTQMQHLKRVFHVKEIISAGSAVLQETLLRYSCVMLFDIPASIRNDLIKFCYANHIEVYTSSKLTDYIVRGASNVLLLDTPLLHIDGPRLTFTQRFLKRTLDIVLASILILLASPFMIATAIAVKSDGGPALYKQQRCTINGKCFLIYKFRSMIVDAEKNGAQLASQGDSRITKVGAFIRKVRLDELPQLINILKGDMSFVGPRPERPEIIAEYVKDIPEFNFRLAVKAGLTGYAQIYGKYNTTPADKLKLDMIYINNYSLLIDLKLILMTAKVVLLPDSTEGIAEGQRTAAKKNS